MAWIKSCQELWNHPKTSTLAFLLDEEIYAAIGRLHILWWWALDYAKDGDLTNISSRIIAQKLGWKGDPEQLINALVESGFVDSTNDGLFIHDWDEYTGDFAEKREKSALASSNTADQGQLSMMLPWRFRWMRGTTTGQPRDKDGTLRDCPMGLSLMSRAKI